MKKRLFAGAFAGALGGLAMKAVVRFMDRDSFGLSAETDANAAHEIWRRMHWPRLGERRAEQIGAAMHYGFAIASGVIYAASAARFPIVRTGRGAAFGAALWLIGDEMAVSVSGLANPLRTPAVSHISALGAHVLYGMVIDVVTSGRRLGASEHGIHDRLLNSDRTNVAHAELRSSPMHPVISGATPYSVSQFHKL